MQSVSDIASRPSSGGFRWLIWIGLLAAAFLAVWLVMMSLTPMPSALAPWIYPGSRAISPSNALPFECRVFATTDDWSVVNRWYSATPRAATGNGDPAFTMSSMPFGGERLGLKLSLASNAFLRASLHCERTSRQVTAAIVSQAPDEAAASVTMFALSGSFAPTKAGDSMVPAFEALAYPGAKRGSGGSAGHAIGFQFTSPDAMEDILPHFLAHFGFGAAPWMPPGRTARSSPASNANSIASLPVPARAGVDERALVVQTPTNICLLHLARGSNAPATEIILSVLPR